MTINSTRKAERFRATLLDGNPAGTSTLSTTKLPADTAGEWAFIRPLTSFGRAVRLLANEAIDATRGRYDR